MDYSNAPKPRLKQFKAYYIKTLSRKEKSLVISNLSFKSLPDDKILALSKLEAFVDDNFSVAQMLQYFSDRIENSVGKGENFGFQHFLLFQQCFQKPFFFSGS